MRETFQKIELLLLKAHTIHPGNLMRLRCFIYLLYFVEVTFQ